MRLPLRFSKHSLSKILLPLALLVAPTLTSARTTDAAGMNIVYCDVERTIAEVDEGKDARKLLDREQQKRESEISTREADLKKMQDDLEKQAKAFSRSAIERKAAEIQEAYSEYQQLLQRYNKELGDLDHLHFDPIDHRLKDMMRTVANRDGYDMILSKRSVPYGRKDLDVTDKMIQEYNRTYPVLHPLADLPEKKGDKPKPKTPPPVDTRAPKMK